MSEDVVVERRGRAGIITLDRPEAMNALTHEMVRAVLAALEAWRDEPAIETVVLQGAGDRGLCAGGDVVGLRRAILDGELEGTRAFFRDEYRMDAAVARFPKPVVALMDGVVLGGGVGIGGHASHRVVTERSRVGFPEVTIGFAPDVGASWLLSRPAAGRVGAWMALTGQPVGAAAALRAGLADHHVPSDRLAELVGRLEHEDAGTAIAALATSPAPGPGDDVPAAFDEPIVERVLAALDAGPDADRETAELIRTKSPSGLRVAAEARRRGAELPSLEAALAQELRIVAHAITTHDLVEGIRAQLVDKDRAPRWQPATLAAVTDDVVDAYFAPPPGGDLDLPTPSPTARSAS
ncbi:enoyl-CoA hydratase/isomerase family protein [Agrococcus sp. SGAir0287]|uniref:enoyl-CoA hydratase/isomerase family protein n=1 Tax=Agrococcus sp. SGAir0287 TaxID=2070347 RepID=UPI0010CD5827|nr:3-hydroxyisobutyryl-CoA hydrolase [Agrococcus sp. SGAir0287]QCR18417.1 3-hydroxyisobutyryl-CoA hydrolase [Agrococcus sp. SGAir0287]